MTWDVNKIRKEFPILDTQVNGRQLVYLDNAATTQKPLQVIERMNAYYRKENSNVHRGVHHLSQIATEVYEQARKNLAAFIGAESEKEVIYTRGTTESVNLLAAVFGSTLKANDEVVVTAMEHHSNLVPWQELCRRKNAHLKVAPVTDKGELDLDALSGLITSRTRLVSVTHVSNVLGTVNPVKEIAGITQSRNVPLMVDGAQAVAHVPVNVAELGCDFYAGSAHKAYGPMGTGFLYGKAQWLEELPPYHYGGEMVSEVGMEQAIYQEIPFKYEAGTPNVAGALGMDAALAYMRFLDLAEIRKYEDHLLNYAKQGLQAIDGVRLLGQAADQTAVISFIVDGTHPYDLGTMLDQAGIAVRTGYHCAQPLIESFGLTGTLRVSLALYNTVPEIDLFLQALEQSVKLLR